MKIKYVKNIALGMILSVLTLTSVANAGLINSDLNVGDGKTVTDDISNLVWLDLTMTQGLTLSSALSLYSDYRTATYDEVSQMVDSYFDTSYVWDNGNNQNLYGVGRSNASAFISLFGETYVRSASTLTNETIGYFQSDIIDQYYSINIAYSTHSSFQSHYNYINRRAINNNLSTAQYGSAGFYLVKDTSALSANSVSVPSTVFMFGIGMIGLIFYRLKKSAKVLN